jgi:iron complex outermembrane receptor protein
VDGWQTLPAVRREVEIATSNTLRDDAYSTHRAMAFDPSLGTVFHASPRLSLRAAVNRAFRAPTFGELYRPFRARGGVITEPNPALSPERLLGAEAGIDVSVSPRLVARATFFSSWLADPIIAATVEAAGPTSRTIAPCGVVSAFGVCRQMRNAGRLWSGGADVEVELRPAEALAFSMSYMYNRSRVVDAPGQPQLVGKFNRQSPVHQGVFEATYVNRRIARITTDVRVLGRRFEDDINTIAIAPFVSVDLHVARSVSDKLTAFVTAQNLLNRLNELTHTDDGIYSVTGPRQVNAGLRLRF